MVGKWDIQVANISLVVTEVLTFIGTSLRKLEGFKKEEAWYSLEQYIGLKEDKLSSTTVDFIRSEGNLETKRLYWFSKPKMC